MGTKWGPKISFWSPWGPKSPNGDQLGSSGEASQKEHVTNLLMVELLKAMEAASHDETILKAKEKFKVLMAGEEGRVSPDELEQVL